MMPAERQISKAAAGLSRSSGRVSSVEWNITCDPEAWMWDFRGGVTGRLRGEEKPQQRERWVSNDGSIWYEGRDIADVYVMLEPRARIPPKGLDDCEQSERRRSSGKASSAAA